MLHLLTVSYERDCLFHRGQRHKVTETMLLNMDGVKAWLHEPVYRKYNPVYHLSPYLGQAYKDHVAERIV